MNGVICLACGTVLKNHTLGACFKATGDVAICMSNGVESAFDRLDYNGQGQVSSVKVKTNRF